MPLPSVRRTVPSASASGTPIARMTPEALSWPSWHAEPVEAATAGAPASTAFPGRGGSARSACSGVAASGSPFSRRSGIARRSAPRARPAGAAVRAPCDRGPRPASSQATPSPTMEATFSVPGRSPRSCPAPSTNGASGVPRRTYSAPTPFGAYSLWPATESRSTPSFAHVDRDLADGLRGVGVDDRAALRARGRNLRDRLQHPGLVVRVHDRHERRACADRRARVVPRARPSESTPRRVTRQPCRSSQAQGAAVAGCSTTVVTT